MQNEIVKLDFTPQQKELIKSQIAPKATDDELKLFIYQAQRTGLDPLARQIYAIHRKVKDGDVWKDRMTIQTSIDGFRVIAERSGTYAGQDEPKFEYDTNNKLVSATINVYKFNNDVRYLAASAKAFWIEYVQIDRDGKPVGLWAKMPHTMLSKVAEALALRKAFPQDLSGLYTGEEMEQAAQDIPHTVVKTKPCAAKTFDAAVNKIQEAPEADRPGMVSAMISTYQLTPDQLATLKPYETPATT